MFVSILKQKQIYKLEYEYYPVYLEYNSYLLDWLELWPQNYKTELRMKKLRVFTHMIHSGGGRRFIGVVVGGWFCWKTLGAIERYEETETARMGTWNSRQDFGDYTGCERIDG